MLFIMLLSLSQDKVLSNKTPKLDRSDGVKEMKEKAPKRKLPFTAGANGDQKDSDSGKIVWVAFTHMLHLHLLVSSKGVKGAIASPGLKLAGSR